jgi:hypothetical protein
MQSKPDAGSKNSLSRFKALRWNGFPAFSGTNASDAFDRDRAACGGRADGGAVTV